MSLGRARSAGVLDKCALDCKGYGKFLGVMSLDKFHTYPLPHGKHRSYINTDNNTAVRQVTQDIRMHIPVHLNRVRNKHNIELQFKQ